MSHAEVLGKDIDDLNHLCNEAGYSVTEARKCAYFLYRKGVCSFMEMETLPKSLRSLLDKKYSISWHSPINQEISDDGTKKYLFKTKQGNSIETAYMPGYKRTTLCISTQAGCRMGCSFCLSGIEGLLENLSAGEILNQLISIPDHQLVNRIVYMGMGEPLDNFENVKRSLEILTADWGMAFGASNITVSTVGFPAELEQLLLAGLCNIAISLHSPFSKERKSIMPIENKYPIEKTIALVKKIPLPKPLRLSFEYILLKGINDSPAHVVQLAKILEGIKCHVNLIPLNSHQETQFVAPTEIQARRFQQQLNSLGISTTVRFSRGRDINAACGQFSASVKS